MNFYADEDFPLPVVEILRRLGHDVLTVLEDGRTGSPDADILQRAFDLGRVLLTHNRSDFAVLDLAGAAHCGIVSATRDRDVAALAGRIDQAVAGMAPGRWHVRVNRPNPRPPRP